MAAFRLSLPSNAFTIPARVLLSCSTRSTRSRSRGVESAAAMIRLTTSTGRQMVSVAGCPSAQVVLSSIPVMSRNISQAFFIDDVFWLIGGEFRIERINLCILGPDNSDNILPVADLRLYLLVLCLYQFVKVGIAPVTAAKDAGKEKNKQQGKYPKGGQ